MCGICGGIRLERGDAPPLSRGQLIAMTDVMRLRGPDERGILERNGMSIGVRRLSIVDVAAGHQPIANEDQSVWAGQNGELFNQDELRRDLAADGHRLETQCDTEVIPHLYERYGIDFPTHLRGMFAIALWDEKRERGMLSGTVSASSRSTMRSPAGPCGLHRS